MVTGLVIIYLRIAPIFPAKMDAINLKTQNSPNLLPKFRSLLSTYQAKYLTDPVEVVN